PTRALPSFPTRRSSDLPVCREADRTWLLCICCYNNGKQQRSGQRMRTRRRKGAEKFNERGQALSSRLSAFAPLREIGSQHASHQDRKSTRLNSSHVKIS